MKSLHTEDVWSGALDRILLLVSVLGKDMAHRLAQDGLSEARAALLWNLRGDQPRTQHELADALGVSPRNITGLVDGLAATGFVTREPHPTDRRATVVRPTAKGDRVLAVLAAEQRTLARQLFEDLPEATLTALLAGLDHVLAVVTELGATEPHLADVLPRRKAPAATSPA